jgi:erythromycin esterase-like protein/predicted phosphoribosyltransferase
MRFRDRVEAGRQLARAVSSYGNRHDVLVLALPRGGVPVGYEVARELRAPFDVFLVRKLGVPGHPELAMGAIASGGVRVLSEDLIHALGIPRSAVEQVAVRERLELERRDRLYRGDRSLPELRERTVILVDDGLATGATMEAAIEAVRVRHPARVVVAAPVCAPDTAERLKRIADEVVCAQMPDPFQAVGLWYERFDQTTDDEVIQLLESARAFSPARTATFSPEGPRSGENEIVLTERRPFSQNEDHSDGTKTFGQNEDRSGRAKTVSQNDVMRSRAQELEGAARDYDALIEAIGDAHLVLIGEATHGTHEFYQERAVITDRLIAEKGFTAVAVEADWPDAYRVNRYVRGMSDDRDSVEALTDFGRFPTWMWRNTDVVDFISWLRAHNDTRPDDQRVGFYGIDLYSLRSSMEAVLEYLKKVDPPAVERARQRYSCFDQFREEPQAYGYATEFGLSPTCEREAIAMLAELQRRRSDYASRDGRLARDEYFFAEQNARLVKNAEEYYRSMFRSRDESWNLRDRHMTDTLVELMRLLSEGGRPARIVVWAHNSHLGDARATEMGDRGELNVGQLVRERFGADAVLIGQTTHTGTVTAASEWDRPAERKIVRPSMTGSYERLFHDTGIGRMLLPLRDDAVLASAVATTRLERAIGVIYLPRTERRSHYFVARLPNQFDFVLHFDQTTALEPLERTVGWETGEPAETFPSGL